MSYFISLAGIVGALFALKCYLFPEKAAPFITDRPKPIAHRGLYDNDAGIPENSLMAFNRAVEKGYAIELDVMLTKDGEVLVHHDHDFARLSDSSKRVDELTLAQIRKISLLSTQESPPTLYQALKLVAGKVPLYIEIKHERPESAGLLEEKVAELLSGYSGDVAILSFNPDSLRWFAENAPQYQRALNFEPEKDERGQPLRILESLLRKSWISRPHFLVYDYHQMPDFIVSGFSFLRVVVPYTIKTRRDFEAVARLGHNVIFEKLEV